MPCKKVGVSERPYCSHFLTMESLLRRKHTGRSSQEESQLSTPKPSMDPTAKVTRPAGTPLPGQGMGKWSQTEHLRSVIENGGSENDTISNSKGGYSQPPWCCIGGTSTIGWLESDKENRDRVAGVVMEELRKTGGMRLFIPVRYG